MEFNGRAVVDSSALPPMVGVTPVGKKIPVVVLRDGERVELPTVIAELPEDDQVSSLPGAKKSKPAEVNRLNVVVEALDQGIRDEYDVGSGGVLVSKVDPGAAARAGIRVGDVILKLNNQSVEDVESFADIVANLPSDKNVSVLIQRRSGPVFLALKVEELDKD